MRGLIYIFMILMLAGCSCSASHHVRGLDEAERLLQSDPTAALSQLNAYDLSEFNDSAVMARWALLYSDALVANGLYAPNDTIVNIAIDYYGRHDCADEWQHASRVKALLSSSDTNRDELAIALYLQKEKEFMLFKERVKLQQILLSGVLVLLVAISIIILQRQRIRLKEAGNRALMTEASVMREDLMKRQSECEAMASRLASSLAGRFNVIDELCITYYESQGNKAERKMIADKVKSQIEALKTDAGVFEEMERIVNNCHEDMLTHLTLEWPDIKLDDYKLMTYMACGFSNRAIALLVGESIEVIYKRKSRLKSRLRDLSLPHGSLFLTIFGR